MGGLGIAGLAVVVAAILVLFGTRSRIGPARRAVGTFARSAAANAVPIFYIGMMAFFLALFDRSFLAQFAPYSIPHKRFIRACYTLPFASMARLYFSDPGRITRAAVASGKPWASTDFFEYDRILYMPGQECRTCLLPKLARSKHCSVCKCCIAMQDHHCLWVNNCVGLLNFRWFLLFLVVNIYVFSYGWLLLFFALLSSLRAAAASTSGSRGWTSWWWALLAQGDSQRAGACLLLLCTALLPLVVLFAAFHLRYVYAGVTTNEADKWEDIAALIPDRALYKYAGLDILLMRYPDGNINRKLSTDEQRLAAGRPLQLVTSVADLPNIYDRGFVSNLKLLLFPYTTSPANQSHKVSP